jgi:murein DD-endopeptidase MepM/ murein hydrolase activator NlpD
MLLYGCDFKLPVLTPQSFDGGTEVAIASPTLLSQAPSIDVTATVTPTAVVIPEGELSLSSEYIPPSPAPDPLRFVFPVAAPAPVSAWRPPLYPVPWAPTPHDHFYFTRPIGADEVNWPLGDYRYGGVFFEDEVHTGVDIPAPRGTPVLAAGDGKIVWAGYGLYRAVHGDLSDPYGAAVVIRHDFGYLGQQLFTVYGHLQRVDIVMGQGVSVGDQIGLVGDTGFVTGPHLHFEVRVGESDFFTTYNPELWLVPPQGWGVFVARIMNTAGWPYSGEDIVIQSLDNGQVWRSKPYGGGATNSDPYYQENLVVSDLPAGYYDVFTTYAGRFYDLEFEIFPGRVSYITFQGRDGFKVDVPPESEAEYDFPEIDNEEGNP